jgi:hypothetical protein
MYLSGNSKRIGYDYIKTIRYSCLKAAVITVQDRESQHVLFKMGYQGKNEKKTSATSNGGDADTDVVVVKIGYSKLILKFPSLSNRLI